MTAPRRILPGRTHFLTRRIVQRQFLLRPDEKTNQILLYCLAVAARRYGMEVNTFLAMSNHYHLMICDVHGRLPEFMRYFHLMIAKALNVKWKRRENLWSVEQASAIWLVDDEAVLDMAVYTLANPSNADLVESVTDWPGVSSWSSHVNARTIVIERPVGVFSAETSLPERVELQIVPPRRMANPEQRWSPADWNTVLVSRVRSAEAAALDARRRRGVRVVGRRAVRKQHPFDSPRTPEPRRRLRPTLVCGDRDRRMQELEALHVFRRLHRVASEALFNGGRVVAFPTGTWALRSLCQAQAPPAS